MTDPKLTPSETAALSLCEQALTLVRDESEIADNTRHLIGRALKAARAVLTSPTPPVEEDHRERAREITENWWHESWHHYGPEVLTEVIATALSEAEARARAPLVEALEFYANRLNYMRGRTMGGNEAILYDDGKKARAALSLVKGDAP